MHRKLITDPQSPKTRVWSAPKSNLTSIFHSILLRAITIEVVAFHSTTSTYKWSSTLSLMPAVVANGRTKRTHYNKALANSIYVPREPPQIRAIYTIMGTRSTTATFTIRISSLFFFLFCKTVWTGSLEQPLLVSSHLYICLRKLMHILVVYTYRATIWIDNART